MRSPPSQPVRLQSAATGGALPASGRATQAQRMELRGALDQEGSRVVPDPQGPQRQGPSFSLLLLAHLPKGELQVSISPGLGSLILALWV